MLDLAISFAVAAVAGVVIGLEDRAAGAASFAAVFGAVFSVLDRRRARIERADEYRRALELERMLAQAPPAPAEAGPEPAAPPAPAPQAPGRGGRELEAIRGRLDLPLVDLARALPAAALAVVVVVAGSVVLVQEVSDVAIYAALLGMGAVVFVAALWVGRRSEANGYLGAVLLGVASGLAGAVVVRAAIGSNVDLQAVGGLIVVPAVLLASVGGWLGYRSNPHRA